MEMAPLYKNVSCNKFCNKLQSENFCSINMYSALKTYELKIQGGETPQEHIWYDVM